MRFQPHPAFVLDAQTVDRLYLGKNAAEGRQTTEPTLQQTATSRSDGRRLHLPDQAPGASASAFADFRHDGRQDRWPARSLVPVAGAGRQKGAGRKMPGWISINMPLAGVQEGRSALTWRIRIKGKYPQFLYWLAMPFFAPVPREADRFLMRSPAWRRKELLTLDWWPVGSGPVFVSSENDPNRRMVLSPQSEFPRPALIPATVRRADRATPACSR